METRFLNELNKKIINTSSSTEELSDVKKIRKSDIAISKANSSKIRFFKGNNSFPCFLNYNVEVGQKTEKPRRQTKPQKQQTRNRNQTELGSSDNNRRTRVSKSSSKPARRQPCRSKKTTILPGYLASDESMIITSDISDNKEGMNSWRFYRVEM